MLDRIGIDVNTDRMDTRGMRPKRSTVRVELGGPGDHEAAVAIWKASWSAYRRGLCPIPAAHEERVRHNLRTAGAFLLVARDGPMPVGITLGLQAREDGGAGSAIAGLCHISLVFVLPERWGEGVGGQLVDAILREAAGRGYLRAQLWTHKDNLRARRLYESRGFGATGLEKEDDVGERIVHFQLDPLAGPSVPKAPASLGPSGSR